MRIGHRLLALGCLLAVVIAIPVCWPGEAVARSSAARAESAPPMRVVLDRILPKAPDPRATLTIDGRVVNGTGQPIEGAVVRLRYGAAPFHSRSELSQYAAGVGPDPAGSGVEARLPATLAPRGSARWTLRVRLADLGLRDTAVNPSVYPLAVEVTRGGAQLGQVRTFLPVESSAGSRPTRIAWIWPLIDRPHRSDDATFVDTSLDGLLSGTGRLGVLTAVAAGRPREVPLAFALDPALLDDARAMSRPEGFTLRAGRHPRHLPPSRVAAEWLAKLRETVGDQPVIALPYADPDLVAVTRAGRDSDLAVAASASAPLLSRELGRAVTPEYAWPQEGLVDQDTLDNLVGMKARTVVLSDQTFPPSPQNYTPDAASRAATAFGPVRALVADSVLSDILDADTRSPGGATVAEQRFLAETALITAERPNQERSLVIAPPRRWDPSPQFATALLDDTARVPWLAPGSLPELAAGAPVDRGTVSFPSAARSGLLGPRYLRKVGAVADEISRFASVASPVPGSSSSPAAGFGLAVARLESSAWRRDPVGAVRLRAAVSDQLRKQRGGVRILNRSTYTLTGKSGTVPVTVANDLPDVQVGVRLDVRSSNVARLQVGSYPELLQIGPQHKKTVQIRLTATANGIADVQLQLLTPDDKPFSDPVTLRVQATGYGRTAAVITGIALAAVFLAIGVRLVRRALAAGAAGRRPDVNGVGGAGGGARAEEAVEDAHGHRHQAG